MSETAETATPTDHNVPPVDAEVAEVISSPAAILNAENVTAPLYQDQKASFFFKGKKVKDEVTGAVTLLPKRATVNLIVPTLTVNGLVEQLQKSEKVVNFILGAVNEQIIKAAQAQVTDEEKPVNRQSELDLEKLSLEYLANIPASERAGTDISDETWKEFAEDYIKIMPALTNRSVERVTLAAGLLVGKLTKCKNQKETLSFLQGQLAIWAGASERADDFAEVFSFLDSRITTYLSKNSNDYANLL